MYTVIPKVVLYVIRLQPMFSFPLKLFCLWWFVFTSKVRPIFIKCMLFQSWNDYIKPMDLCIYPRFVCENLAGLRKSISGDTITRLRFSPPSMACRLTAWYLSCETHLASAQQYITIYGVKFKNIVVSPSDAMMRSRSWPSLVLSTDRYLHPVQSVGWNYSSIQRSHRWSLGMDK